MDRDFAGLGAEYITFHTYEVADVEKLLEHSVVHLLVLAGAKLVAVEVDLDAAVGVLQLHKGGFAHNAATHNAACHGDFAGRSEGIAIGIKLRVGEVGTDFVGVSVYGVFGSRIGVDTHSAELLERAAAYDFLFAEFENIHRMEIISIESGEQIFGKISAKVVISRQISQSCGRRLHPAGNGKRLVDACQTQEAPDAHLRSAIFYTLL